MCVRFASSIEGVERGQPHKMVKHTKTILLQQPTNCLKVFDHFVGLAPKGYSSARKTL